MRDLTTFRVLICVALVACADPPPSQYPTQTFVEDMTTGQSDLLEIRVSKLEQYSGEFEVGEDGLISYPYIGTVVSAGRTPAQIEAEIRERLADGYLKNPQVVVRIKERRSKKISVFGEVKRSTIVQYAEGMTINEAISQADGFSPRAWKNAVKVTRKSPNGAKEFTVPVEAIATGKAPAFYMRPGDSIYVPKSPM
jgi:polysaccharide export outer membrane protein